jgi:hypothetical protein
VSTLQRVYLETTIPSYLTARPSRDLIVAGHQQVTLEWWQARRNDFDIYVSQFVLDEAGAGDPQSAKERIAILAAFPVVDISEAVLRLALAMRSTPSVFCSPGIARTSATRKW